ncbi:MAG: hypothetical protein CMJ78_01875, partial [Planctomycetaceae bacterium]|nr:hypothetical protein [Planctomycetaceae bacterium]
WREAIGEFPFDKLSEVNQDRAKKIMKSRGMYRRLPKFRFAADKDVYDFFAKHPEAAVAVWQVMAISKFQLKPTGDGTFTADAKDGTVGKVEILHQTKNQIVTICDGTYNSPFLVKPIKATGILHLQAEFETDELGATHVTHVADLFVEFPSPAVEAAAKLISPISNMMADRNFQEVSLFVRLMTLAMSNQPGWVELLVQRMDDEIPLALKDEMLTLTARTFVENRKRVLARKGENVSVDEIMQPLRKAAQESRDAANGKLSAPATIRITRQPSSKSPQ